MTSLQNQRKLANHIFRLLKTNELIFPICRTSRGNLGLRFTPNNEEYEMYLDAVPLTTNDILRDENNIELKKMLEKYLFEQPQLDVSYVDKIYTVSSLGELTHEPVTQDKPKRGRLKGSKNKA